MAVSRSFGVGATQKLWDRQTSGKMFLRILGKHMNRIFNPTDRVVEEIAFGNVAPARVLRLLRTTITRHTCGDFLMTMDPFEKAKAKGSISAFLNQHVEIGGKAHVAFADVEAGTRIDISPWERYHEVSQIPLGLIEARNRGANPIALPHLRIIIPRE